MVRAQQRMEFCDVRSMADVAGEDWPSAWGGVDLTSKDFAPVYVQGVNFYILGYDPSAALDTRLERESVLQAQGRPLLGRGIWPQILGPDGGVISVSLGGSDIPNGAVDWEGPYDFTIGSDTFLDYAVAGKYLAVKFESTGVAGWSLQSYDIDYELLGQF